MDTNFDFISLPSQEILRAEISNGIQEIQQKIVGNMIKELIKGKLDTDTAVAGACGVIALEIVNHYITPKPSKIPFEIIQAKIVIRRGRPQLRKVLRPSPYFFTLKSSSMLKAI